ncbi:MAG: 8-amino-7-oxononanoate synthase [bacterium]
MRSLNQEIEEIRQAHLFRRITPVEFEADGVMRIDGKDYVNFSSNNYLAIAQDPRLKEAANAATQEFGAGSGASRLVTGSLQIHHRLENKIAEFKGTEAALLFNSGYHANLGILTAMLREGDEVYSDALNHASIVDGCRLSRATVKVYRHSDASHLESLLRESNGVSRRLIVTDSIFSMDGDAAPLRDLADLAEKYETWLFVDEAHATGVCGPNGKGLVEEVWPGERPAYLRERLIQMGTLGKALGSFGAYAAGSRELVEFLVNLSRPFIYTTALPPGVSAASLAALQIVEKEPERRRKLWGNIRFLREKLFPDAVAAASPIFPFIVGDSQKALDISQRLKESGFWVTAIRHPTVARGTERLRITLTAAHTKEQIESLIGHLR